MGTFENSSMNTFGILDSLNSIKNVFKTKNNWFNFIKKYIWVQFVPTNNLSVKVVLQTFLFFFIFLFQNGTWAWDIFLHNPFFLSIFLSCSKLFFIFAKTLKIVCDNVIFWSYITCSLLVKLKQLSYIRNYDFLLIYL